MLYEPFCSLSVNSQKKLKQLQDGLHNLKEDDDPIGKWLAGLGITGRLRSLVIEGARILVIIISLVIMSCVLSCIRNSLERVVAKAWVVQKGEIVEGIMAQKGHNILLVANMHNPYTAGTMMTLNSP